jgi:dihydrodipicolinate synthase/N-acetylneuraminate lyase
MKALMDMAGMQGGPVRPPLVDVTQQEHEELRTILETWKSFLD